MDPTAEDDIDTFVRHLAPLITKGTAEEILILRGHLLAERLLRDVLKAFSQSAKGLSDARLSFNQVLRVAQAFTPLSRYSELCEQLELLNRIRNAWAHEIDAALYADQIERLIAMVIHGHKKPPRWKTLSRSRRLAMSIVSMCAALKGLLDVHAEIKARSNPKP